MIEIRTKVDNNFSPFVFDRTYLYRHGIQDKIRQYILCNFLDIAAYNKDMLDLSCEELLDLIEDDLLNSRYEEPIWEFCLQWIAFDEKNRLQHVPKLLGGVRIGLLKQTVINISNCLFIRD